MQRQVICNLNTVVDGKWRKWQKQMAGVSNSVNCWDVADATSSYFLLKHSRWKCRKWTKQVFGVSNKSKYLKTRYEQEHIYVHNYWKPIFTLTNEVRTVSTKHSAPIFSNKCICYAFWCSIFTNYTKFRDCIFPWEISSPAGVIKG